MIKERRESFSTLDPGRRICEPPSRRVWRLLNRFLKDRTQKTQKIFYDSDQKIEENRSGDHIVARDGKSDTLSPIFMGKLPPVPKEANLWGLRMEKRRKEKQGGSLGVLGQALCMPNRWGTTCGECNSNRNRGTAQIIKYRPQGLESNDNAITNHPLSILV